MIMHNALLSATIAVEWLAILTMDITLSHKT